MLDQFPTGLKIQGVRAMSGSAWMRYNVIILVFVITIVFNEWVREILLELFNKPGGL